MNVSTAVVLLAILCAVGLSVLVLRNNKKHGKSCCSGGCDRCSMHGLCRK